MKKLIAVTLFLVFPLWAYAVTGTVASMDTGLSNGVVTFGLNQNPLPLECANKYHFNNRDDLLALVMVYSLTNGELLSMQLDAAAEDGVINTCTITRAATTN